MLFILFVCSSKMLNLSSFVSSSHDIQSDFQATVASTSSAESTVFLERCQGDSCQGNSSGEKTVFSPSFSADCDSGHSEPSEDNLPTIVEASVEVEIHEQANSTGSRPQSNVIKCESTPSIPQTVADQRIERIKKVISSSKQYSKSDRNLNLIQSPKKRFLMLERPRIYQSKENLYIPEPGTQPSSISNLVGSTKRIYPVDVKSHKQKSKAHKLPLKNSCSVDWLQMQDGESVKSGLWKSEDNLEGKSPLRQVQSSF